MPLAASAQVAWPEKPIRLVVSSAAGSGADVMARMLGNQLSRQLGVAFVIENKPGASQVIGMMDVVHSSPDGYTIGYGNLVALSTNKALLPNIPYDTEKDLTLLGGTWQTVNFLVVNPASPYKTVADLIAALRKDPDKLSYASDGNGTSAHLGMELFKHLTGAKMVHVPYKASTAGITDLLGGQIDAMFVNSSVVAEMVKAGRVRALAVSSAKRQPDFPQVPAVNETVPGYEVTAWAGMVAPAKLPPAIAKRFESEIQKALAAPGMAEKCQALGVYLTPQSAEGFRSLVRAETTKWAEVVKVSGAKLD
ncbi:tripartite tricarboxylate transporter substrate binding protein [Xylophilus rhododendri]|uniref:Tripartite tricarboxylate transporter substrate binding protein n=1 Tax=Xylophilus rhododendri TaxID=2697032 RepID=A0A857J4E1_9BURK|nr:tripartite tricarboxylate transporter substrate binding protein [Xylophilus rhododendri]QHI97725.1 tripartite tricarboxylate transporter substrate binding protein [Xylophilus rhododendri]